MSTTENMIVTENIGLKAPKEDAFYEVGYIAENNEIIDRKFADVGNLEDMNSEIGASTMVEALNLTFQSGNEKRGILASNLVAMGVEADASETWDILLPKVKDISTGVDTSNDTVVAEVLLEGYTAHDANQEQIVGTLPDKTGTEEYTATATLDSTNSELQMTIPAMGKYGTNNKLKATFAKIASLIGLTAAKLVKGNTILGITGNSNNMDTSVGTITSANQLLKGIIGCSDGKTYTGTVVDRRGTTVAATAVSQDDTYTYFKTPAGCYSEESMVRTENSNLGAKLLWTNSAPTATFDSKKVSLDLAAYDAVMVEFMFNNNIQTVKSRVVCQIGYSDDFGAGYVYSNGSVYGRNFNADIDGVWFNNAFYGANNTGTSYNNTIFIPYKIYGIKNMDIF